MRQLLFALAASLLGLDAIAITAGPNAPEPVNLISETGLDVGPCADGGLLSYPPAPYKGSPYFLRQADAGFASRHDGLTQQRAPWLHRLDGPSGANRLYTARHGGRAVVLSSCMAGDCGGHEAYGAYGLESKKYQLLVHEGGKSELLGSRSELLAAAIECTQARDRALRDQARRAAKIASPQ